MENKEYYIDYLKNTDKFPQSVYHRAKHEMVRETLSRVPAGSPVLDAGCGVGNISGKYCGMYKVTGVDEQLSAIQYCKQFCPGTYMHADLYHIPLADNTFDLVLFLDAIEHLARPVEALKELARVLKPGGLILICTMDYDSPLWFILENTWHRFFGGTCKPYSKNVHPTQYTAPLLGEHCSGLFEEVFLQKRMLNMELFYLGRKPIT